MVLCILMCLSLLPVGALAAEEESPVEELLIEELPVEELPEEVFTEEAPTEETPIEETPIEEAPVEEEPIEETPTEEVPEEEILEELPEEALEEPDDQILAVEGPVAYLIHKNGTFETETCTEYTYRTTGSFSREETLTSGWYVLGGGSAWERITVSGDVKFILLNGADCYFPYGIGLHIGSKLTIFAQPAEEGKSVGQLRTGGYTGGTTTSGYDNEKHTGGAGIGGGQWGHGVGVTVYGSTLEAVGGEYAAGIGGGGCCVQNIVKTHVPQKRDNLTHNRFIAAHAECFSN